MGGACAARVRVDVETDSCPSSMSTRTGDRILTSRAVYAAVFASTLEEMNSRMPFYQRVLHALAAGRRSMKVGVARRTRRAQHSLQAFGSI